MDKHHSLFHTRAAFSIITVVAVVAFIEVFSWLGLSYLHGHVMTHGELRASQREIANIPMEMGQEEWLEESDTRTRVVHPFVGYVHSFNHIEEYIDSGSGGQVVVGITGGSVARHFAVDGTARKAFLEHLKEIPAFKGREIVLVNLAADAYKQPQQLMVLQYMLAAGATFDVFIELDGVNEIWHTHSNFYNKTSYLYPQLWPLRMNMLRKRISGEHIENLMNRRLSAARQMYQLPIIGSSFTLNAFWSAYDGYLVRKTQEPLALEDDEKRPYEVYGPEHPEHSTWELAVQDEIVLWARSSKMMNDLAKNNNILYVHFLQPNQYIGSKPFSEEERAIALWNNDHRKQFAQWYPVLQEQGELLEQQGISFNDLTMIFRDVPQVLYNDSCCHLNITGSTLLGHAMADRIISDWGKQK